MFAYGNRLAGRIQLYPNLLGEFETRETRKVWKRIALPLLRVYLVNNMENGFE